MRKPCVVVPALDAAETIDQVLDDLSASLGLPIIVVDDGSTDGTQDRARARGACVLRHEQNRGKGAAILSGLREAARRGFEMAVTADADGQHPGSSARMVLEGATNTNNGRALALGVRDLARDHAPRLNRFGNGVSNLFVSLFAGKRLHDTQCGLRSYPVAETLALCPRSQGYEFEAEVVLRAVAAGLPIVEVPVRVLYPPDGLRRTHFRTARDPARIVATVVTTVLELRRGGRPC
jgi:glycosyltransferase involved in cell wall biosynthesis